MADDSKPKLDHRGYPIKEDDIDDLLSPIDYPKTRRKPLDYQEEFGELLPEGAKELTSHDRKLVRDERKGKRHLNISSKLAIITDDLNAQLAELIALSTDKTVKPSDRIKALQLLFAYRYGTPASTTVLVPGTQEDNPISEQSYTKEDLEALYRQLSKTVDGKVTSKTDKEENDS